MFLSSAIVRQRAVPRSHPPNASATRTASTLPLIGLLQSENSSDIGRAALMRAARGGFTVWEVATGRIAMQKQILRHSVCQFALAPDGRRAIVRYNAGADDGTALLY